MDECEIKRILEQGSINEIDEVYCLYFHQMKHVESFGILIDRLRREIKKESAWEMFRRLYRIHDCNFLRKIISICSFICHLYSEVLTKFICSYSSQKAIEIMRRIEKELRE